MRNLAFCGVSAWLSRSHWAAASDVKRFGLIAFSTNGLTVSEYKLSQTMLADAGQLSGYERLDPIRVADIPAPIRTPLVPGADETTVASTADIIASRVDVLLARGISRSDIIVLVSSGLDAFAGQLVAKLGDMLRLRTGVDLHLLSAREQGRLQFDWVVPPRLRGQVFQLEIGGGNSRGGFFDHPGRAGRYFDVSVPFGTKTLAAAVKARWPDVRTFDFPARAAEYYADAVFTSLASRPQEIAATLKMPDVVLTGNIVRAAAVILYPHEIVANRRWIDFSPDAFARMRSFVEAGTPYGIVPDDLTQTQRASLLKIRSTIRSIFNPHQIAAGAALADGLSRQLMFASRRKIRYPIGASNGWTSQYLLENFKKGRRDRTG